MSPISRMMSDSTVAKTGRLMHISGRSIENARASGLRRRRRGVRLGRRDGRRRRALNGGNLNRHAVANLELARGDDDVAVAKALHYFGFAIPALADLDLRAVRLAVDDPVHEPLVALRDNGLLWHDQRFLFFVRQQ